VPKIELDEIQRLAFESSKVNIQNSMDGAKRLETESAKAQTQAKALAERADAIRAQAVEFEAEMLRKLGRAHGLDSIPSNARVSVEGDVMAFEWEDEEQAEAEKLDLAKDLEAAAVAVALERIGADEG